MATCEESSCGREFTPAKSWQRFCSAPCRHRNHLRKAGAKLINGDHPDYEEIRRQIYIELERQRESHGRLASLVAALASKPQGGENA